MPNHGYGAELRKSLVEQVSGKLRAGRRANTGGSSFEWARPTQPSRTDVLKLPQAAVRLAQKDALESAKTLESTDARLAKVFVSDLEWDGVVQEITQDKIIGVARDVADKFGSEKILTIPLSMVSPSQRKYAVEGAIFRLCVGSEVDYRRNKKDPSRVSTQAKRDSKIYFRRYIYKSPERIARMGLGIANLSAPDFLES